MAVNPVKTPFSNMSYTPDVPSSALGPNEYNAGRNIETNTRGINSVAGDEYILSQVLGNQIFVTSGFGSDGVYYFIIATTQGQWWQINQTGGITNITPSVGTFTGYNTSTIITDSWNGTVLFLNDMINPPMYFEPGAFGQIRLYDNGPDNYLWNYDVGYNISGNVVPLYSSLTAGFIRVYNSPNLGSLLVSGNLTGEINANVVPGGGTVQNLPTTIRWSQNFGLNAGPTTWAPTVTNTANEVELPVRGPVVDGFPLNGNFYICSYWDTCVMSPIAYQSSTVPVFGIKLINQGRGMLNENCWANVDNTVFGLDARDIWQFDGGTFKPIGNQRIKDWFYNNLNPLYTNQLFMQHNSSKYQIEIYFPDLNSTGQCNQMLAYRYDLDVWQAPRQVTKATQATEAPRYVGGDINLATRGMVYSTYETNAVYIGTFTAFVPGPCTGTSSSIANTQLYWEVTQKSTSGTGTGLVLRVHVNDNETSYGSNASLYEVVDGGSGYYVDDTVTFSGAELGGVDGDNDLTIVVSAVIGTADVSQLVQKDSGTSFLGNTTIDSLFQRNNISFGQPYSASVQVHRVLPEVYGTGNVNITVGGANSVASTPVYKPTKTMTIATENPWVQINQNEARVTTIQVGANTSVDSWQMTAANWQITVVQDTR